MLLLMLFSSRVLVRPRSPCSVVVVAGSFCLTMLDQVVYLSETSSSENEWHKLVDQILTSFKINQRLP